MLLYALTTGFAALLAVVSGIQLITGTAPPPLSEEEREAWAIRHPLTPAPEPQGASPGALLTWRVLLVLTSIGAGLGAIVLAAAHPLLLYLGVGGACLAGLWLVACLAAAQARANGSWRWEPTHAGARTDAQRWEILDLYVERLGGELATGLPSTREDLARRARRVFRKAEDVEFLRHVRQGSASEAYRTAAAQALEDVG